MTTFLGMLSVFIVGYIVWWWGYQRGYDDGTVDTWEKSKQERGEER